MKFRLGCELAYKVVAETVFIFNVQVAFLQRHINLVDQLNFNPNLPRRFYTVPDLRNRYTQVVAPVGDLSLSYTAEVDLDIFEPILQRSTRWTFGTFRSTFCLIFFRADLCHQTGSRTSRCASSPGSLEVTFASV